MTLIRSALSRIAQSFPALSAEVGRQDRLKLRLDALQSGISAPSPRTRLFRH